MRFKILAAILIVLYLLSIGAAWGRPQLGRRCTLALDPEPESDFLVFYAASSLAWSKQPEGVYDIRMKTEEEKILQDCNPRPFLYPPTYLVMILPLVLVSFYPSLLIWNALTLAGFLAVMRRVCVHNLIIWVSLAFPGVFQSVIRGQNACLSTFFVGAGILLLKESPFVAGLCLGLMCYKPTLFPLIPLALLAGRHWRALAGCATSVVMLILISVIIFGPDIWLAYARQLSLISAKMRPGSCFGTPLQFSVTFFGSAAFLAGVPSLARWFQGLIMVIMALIVTWSWSRPGPLIFKGSILVGGMLLFPPHALIYDLTLLALPQAWLAREGHSKGWMSSEIPLLATAYTLPASAPFLAALTGLPFAPLVLTGIIAFSIVKQCAIIKQQTVPLIIKDL
jgi:hypothetical protein